MGVWPVHVPAFAVSVEPVAGVPANSVSPTMFSPLIVGRTVLTGGSAPTVAVGGEFALALPSAFLAVTITRSCQPKRSAVIVKNELFAVDRSKHDVVTGSHFFH